MRFINTTESEPIRGGAAQGLVRRRGVRFEAGGREFRFERREPIAVVLLTGEGPRRVALPQARFNPLPAILPVAGYLIARRWSRRHRRKP